MESQRNDFVTQMAEYYTFNVGVVGSTPIGVTKIGYIVIMVSTSDLHSESWGSIPHVSTRHSSEVGRLESI